MKQVVPTKAQKINFRRVSLPLIVATLSLVPLNSAIAQTLPQTLYEPGSDNLQSVVQRAISTNPEVEAAWRRLNAAEHDIGVARGNIQA